MLTRMVYYITLYGMTRDAIYDARGIICTVLKDILSKNKQKRIYVKLLSFNLVLRLE